MTSDPNRNAKAKIMKATHDLVADVHNVMNVVDSVARKIHVLQYVLLHLVYSHILATLIILYNQCLMSNERNAIVVRNQTSHIPDFLNDQASNLFCTLPHRP